MNTIEEMKKRVNTLAFKIRETGQEYGIIESNSIAIKQVRRELETALESDMNNPYSDGPTWSVARLTLFNSIYR